MSKQERQVVYLPSVSEDELRDALAKCAGDIPATAAYLGVHRATIYRLVRRYDLAPVALRAIPARDRRE